MNRNYECMVLLDNREVRQGWDALKDNVSGMLTKHGAEVVSSKLWEERRLAYPINHQLRGTYLLIYFKAETAGITPINRELKISESVMRHMVTVCEDIPESAHEPEKDFDPTKIGIEEEKKAEPAAAEASGEAEKAEKAEATAEADAKGSDESGSEDKGSEDKGSEDKGSEDKGSEDQGSEDKGSEDKKEES